MSKAEEVFNKLAGPLVKENGKTQGAKIVVNKLLETVKTIPGKGIKAATELVKTHPKTTVGFTSAIVGAGAGIAIGREKKAEYVFNKVAKLFPGVSTAALGTATKTEKVVEDAKGLAESVGKKIKDGGNKVGNKAAGIWNTLKTNPGASAAAAGVGIGAGVVGTKVLSNN